MAGVNGVLIFSSKVKGQR